MAEFQSATLQVRLERTTARQNHSAALTLAQALLPTDAAETFDPLRDIGPEDKADLLKVLQMAGLA